MNHYLALQEESVGSALPREGVECGRRLCAEQGKEEQKNRNARSGCLFVRSIGVGRHGQVGDAGQLVVKYPYGTGKAFVIVFLLEPVFSDAFGNGGVYEGVIADEDAYMADALAAAGLEKHKVAGLELAALDLPADAGHFRGSTGQFRVEPPVIHEPHKPRAVEPRRALPAEAVADAEKLADVAEKAPDGAICIFNDRLDGALLWRGLCNAVGRWSQEEGGEEKGKQEEGTDHAKQ